MSCAIGAIFERGCLSFLFAEIDVALFVIEEAGDYVVKGEELSFPVGCWKTLFPNVETPILVWI